MEHLEGRQSIYAALQARQRRIDVILIGHGSHVDKLEEVIALAMEQGVPIQHVDRAQLDAIAHGATHGGIVAVCSAKPRLGGEQLVAFVEKLREPALLLLLEGVEDARNLGFTIRSAEALGAHAILVKKHLWDLDATEVGRPSAGALERLPLAQIEGVGPLKALQKMGVQLVGCLAGARRTIYDVNFTQPTIVAIGGEKRGLSGAVREICDCFATIPTLGEATSLSLSHAASVVLAEAMRQRLERTKRKRSDRIEEPPATAGKLRRDGAKEDAKGIQE
jgi:23S rRNA (guanosine2251-2'-O)-methyltransferase